MPTKLFPHNMLTFIIPHAKFEQDPLNRVSELQAVKVTSVCIDCIYGGVQGDLHHV